MKRLRTWFRANFLDYRLWRVTYTDGSRTYLLHREEAKGCAEVFNGRLWIDYDADFL